LIDPTIGRDGRPVFNDPSREDQGPAKTAAVIKAARKALALRPPVPGDPNIPRAIAGWGATAVDPKVADFVKAQHWDAHHPLWHMIHRWAELSKREQNVLRKLGWEPPRNPDGSLAKQEGQPGNGEKFAAMHGYMFNKLIRSGFGAKVPAWTDGDWQRLRPRLGADDQKSIDMLMELNRIDLDLANPPETQIGKLFKDMSLDDFAAWVESQRFATNPAAKKLPPEIVRIAGAHNRVHMALSIDGSKIDLGDPGKNLHNKDFWGWHGVLDGAFQRFLKWYATPEQRESYARMQKDEGERMDAATKSGQRVLKAILNVENASAADKRVLKGAHLKAFPIAMPEDLPAVAER
jgi:hypothetical protein